MKIIKFEFLLIQSLLILIIFNGCSTMKSNEIQMPIEILFANLEKDKFPEDRSEKLYVRATNIFSYALNNCKSHKIEDAVLNKIRIYEETYRYDIIYLALFQIQPALGNKTIKYLNKLDTELNTTQTKKLSSEEKKYYNELSKNLLNSIQRKIYFIKLISEVKPKNAFEKMIVNKIKSYPVYEQHQGSWENDEEIMLDADKKIEILLSLANGTKIPVKCFSRTMKDIVGSNDDLLKIKTPNGNVYFSHINLSREVKRRH